VHTVRIGLAYHGWTILYDTVGHFWRYWIHQYSPMEMIMDWGWNHLLSYHGIVSFRYE